MIESETVHLSKALHSAMLSLCLLGALGVSGCGQGTQSRGGTSTGNPFDAEPEEPEPPAAKPDDIPDEGIELPGGQRCAHIRTDDVDADEITPRGFTAREVLELVEGAHETSLLWQTTTTTVGPELSESTIEVNVTVTGPPQWAHYELETQAAPSTAVENELPLPEPDCLGELLINAEVEVRSADGALDERGGVLISVKNPKHVMLTLPLNAESLGGELMLDAVPPQGEWTVGAALSIVAGITEFGLAGEVVVGGEFQTSDSLGTTQEPLATFPTDSPCGSREGRVPHDADGSPSLTELLEAFNGASQQLPVTYASPGSDIQSSVLSLSYSTDAEYGCMSYAHAVNPSQQPETALTELMVEGVVALSSLDSLLEGSLPVRLTLAQYLDGPRTDARGNLNVQSGEDTEAFLQRAGIHAPVDFSGTIPGYGSVTFEATSDEQQSRGDIVVWGSPVCDPPPCMPGMQSELFRAAWGESP